MTPLLLIDVSNICHRAYHALAGRGDIPATSQDIVYSFLRTIGKLRQNFGTDRFAFCFDHTVSVRREIFPEYKQKRKEKAVAEQEQRAQLVRQIKELGRKHLPALGFSNIFRCRGMESDDLMAAIVRSRKEDEIILVTSDNDLFQCLRKNVSIYLPHTRQMYTQDNFMETYGIYPKQWADVKSMAGCSTDGIPGLLGVGEQGALKYLRGELKESSSQHHWITCERGQEQIASCRRLVKLPFVGCPIPEITEDTGIKWDRMGRMRL